MNTPKILSILPPMTQLNTPYPSTAYLTGFLHSQGYSNAQQADLGLELIVHLLTASGLNEIRGEIQKKNKKTTQHDSVEFFLEAFDDYHSTITAVIDFLQNKDQSLAHRIANRRLLPEGPRFQALLQAPLEWAFGNLGLIDQAKYLCTLYLDDLTDVLTHGIDPHFSISRYGEKLSASSASFEPLEQALTQHDTLITRTLERLTQRVLNTHTPDVVLLSVPFPGNLLGALYIAKTIKTFSPKTITILGGGYPNTELRSLTDPNIFNTIDFITLDDGEKPLLCILEHLNGNREKKDLLRTYYRQNDVVHYASNTETLHDIPFKNTGTPTYAGLPLSNYLSLLEMLNPMHRIWSDTRWNKLTLAHGCYWKKCSFCDVSLDYIGRYDPAGADLTVDRMEKIISETQSRGFHFVDEAAPPALLESVSKKIIERKLVVSYWGNIRFEKKFDRSLTTLMADAGCIAVSGGLEVASDRLLKLMNKGVDIAQVARVTKAFSNAGILVHAYLMYGFPTQTMQETIDSLERVRQLFKHKCLSSAYWHRFSATVHSPIGLSPSQYQIKIIEPEQSLQEKKIFARNDLNFIDLSQTNAHEMHDALSFGLKKALYNYMHEIGLDEDVRAWFDFEVPKAQVDKRLIAKALQSN